MNSPLVYNYHYDQLNRLVNMDAYSGLTSNSFTPVHLDAYKEEVSYDPNGNITTYKRNGDAARLTMDNMAYHYKPATNQLDKVVDEASDAAAGDYDKYRDIKYHSQSSGNYTYDAIGNLTSDASEGITGISWSVYGKILSLVKNGNTISYSYDASGNRISKTAGGTTTVYVRDATGNVMSVYEKAVSTALTQSEVHLYGSSRIGMVRALTVPPTTILLEGSFGTATLSTYTRGEKSYELSNHLGNVLVTVSDRRLGVSTSSSTVDYYTADVVSAQDYYPFGMLMPGRQYGQMGRYGFNGKENDNEIKGEGNSYDYGARIYDPRIGRWLSVDAYADKYPNVSPYSFAINSPLQFKDANGHWLVDKDGNIIYTMGDPYYVIKDNIVYKAKDYFFYTNDGQAVQAVSYMEKTPVSNVKFKNGIVSPENVLQDIDDDKIESINNGDPLKSNCHGTSLNFFKGQLDMYVPGLDDEKPRRDNVSKVFKNTAEFTPVNAKDVKPGDVALFDDGNGNIAHSATVEKVKGHGRKVKLTSKDDRSPVAHNQSIKDIQKNPAYNRLVGYYRHKDNVKVDAEPAEPGAPRGNLGYPNGEPIKKVLEQVKKD